MRDREPGRRKSARGGAENMRTFDVQTAQQICKVVYKRPWIVRLADFRTVVAAAGVGNAGVSRDDTQRLARHPLEVAGLRRSLLLSRSSHNIRQRYFNVVLKMNMHIYAVRFSSNG